MATLHQVSKVVVVGAAFSGVSSAVHLARLGIETVLVNDGPLAKGASGRSLAWIIPRASDRLSIIGLRMMVSTATGRCRRDIRMPPGCVSTVA